MMTLPELISGDVIELVFDDFTTRDDGWLDWDDASKETLATIKLVGMYINHDDQLIRLAFGMVADDKAVATLGMVPMGSVKSVRKLN